MTLVDTSALYAYLDRRDESHERARDSFHALIEQDDQLVAHDYVVLEASSLVQRRLGPEAVRTLFDEILPLIVVHWVDERLHHAAVSAMLSSLNRRISLVDWTSFVLMRDEGIDSAFAFDADFVEQGFRTLPTE